MSDEHTVTGDIRDPHTDQQAVEHFSLEMLLKLFENGHKAHWSTKDDSYLFHRLREEVKELEDAITDQRINPVEGNHQSMAKIRECADISNFAMMIADNERRKMESKS